MTNTHNHLFQYEGTTWACWGHDDACGYRAPACFTPIDSAVTKKGMIDLILNDTLKGDPWEQAEYEEEYPVDEGYYFSGTGEWSEDSSYEDYLNG